VSANGIEALEIFRKTKPELILVDIELPGLSGLELIKTIRKESLDTIFFVITGHPKENYILEAINMQIDEFILKPITLSKLNRALERGVQKLGKKEILISKKEQLYYNEKNKTLKHKSKIIPLTHLEIYFLELLLRNKGSIVSYPQIETVVYQDTPMTSSSLRGLAKRVRKKLPGVSIQNIQNVGYRLSEEL